MKQGAESALPPAGMEGALDRAGGRRPLKSSRTQVAFGIRINEVFGQTECNLVPGHNAALMAPARIAGPVASRHVSLSRRAGNELPAGEVLVHRLPRPDPVMLLEYWNNLRPPRQVCR